MNTNNDQPTTNKIPFMNTMTGVSNKWMQSGYTDTITISNNGLYSTQKDKSYGPADVRVVDFYRFEGQSDPADNCILYVVETTDGVKGMVIDAYGTYADDDVTKFMKHVEEINKNVVKRDKSEDIQAA